MPETVLLGGAHACEMASLGPSHPHAFLYHWNNSDFSSSWSILKPYAFMFIFHSLVQQMCIQYLLCTRYCSRHQGDSSDWNVEDLVLRKLTVWDTKCQQLV